MNTDIKPLATLERVRSVRHHPNADRLDIATVLGYECIVGRDQYKEGEYVIFIQPDSILPAERKWCQDLLRYTSKGRIRAVRLRGEWSMGLVIEPSRVQTELGTVPLNKISEGDDYTEILGITKYEPPLPKDIQARRAGLPFQIPRTDEERWQNLRNLDELIGKPVDITLKIDGSSFTAYCKVNEDGTVEKGITSRSIDLKWDSDEYTNVWLEAARKYNILERLENYCRHHKVSLAVRGEVYGNGIQTLSHNPHCRGERDLAIYSVYLIDEHRYADPGEKFYSLNVAVSLGIPHVLLLHSNAVLSKALLNYYDSGLERIADGGGYQPFEGVVVRGQGFSFKIINKYYDSEK